MHCPARCTVFLGLLISLCICPVLAQTAQADSRNPQAGSGFTYQLFAERVDYAQGKLRLEGVSPQIDRYRSTGGPEGDLVALADFISLGNGAGGQERTPQTGVLSLTVDGETREYFFQILGASMKDGQGRLDLTVDFAGNPPPTSSGQALLWISDSSGPLDKTVSLTLDLNVGYSQSDKLVFFQKNNYPAASQVTAWRVYPLTCGQCVYKFSIGPSLNLTVISSHGSSTTQTSVGLGRRYLYREGSYGGYLSLSTYLQSLTTLEVINGSSGGQVMAKLFRNGELLAYTDVATDQTSGFEIDSTLYVGIAEGAQQGSLIDPATVSSSQAIDLSSMQAARITVFSTGEGGGYEINVVPEF
jgi:hypothetical protein